MFKNSGDITVTSTDRHRSPTTMTNKGLQIEFFLIPDRSTPPSRRTPFLAPLNCTRQNGDIVALKLLQRGSSLVVSSLVEFERHNYNLSVVKSLVDTNDVEVDFHIENLQTYYTRVVLFFGHR
jgi:hypothetical protein